MAGRPRANIEQYITNIQPYLEVGCSLYEACLHAVVPYTTVIDYQKTDEEIRKKIERMQNVPILKARQAVVGDMENNSELALKYLERKKKDEFSLRNEHTGADGHALFAWQEAPEAPTLIEGESENVNEPNYLEGSSDASKRI